MKINSSFYREVGNGRSEFQNNGFHPRMAQSYKGVREMEIDPVKYKEIECVINGDYSVKGRREGKEVYMPFSFIQKYFEVR